MKTRNRIFSPRCLSNANLLGFLAFLVVGVCLTVGTVLAGDKGETKKETKKEVKVDQKKKSESEEKTLMTGSLIPQKAKPNRIPVTSSPMIVIDRAEIERSGQATLAGVLKKQTPR